jgi:hypothetical protein
MFLVVRMVLLSGITEVDGGQKGEYVSLQEGHKEFNEKHEDHKEHSACTYSVTCCGT